jgi:hypothetical protein
MNHPIKEDPTPPHTRLAHQDTKDKEKSPITPETYQHHEDLQLFHGENQIDESSSISQYQITRETTPQSETNHITSDLPLKLQNQNK